MTGEGAACVWSLGASIEADSFSFIWQVATVALIVFATRWLLSPEGTQLPKAHGDTRVYRIKWQMRVVGLGLVSLVAAIVVGFRHDLVSASGADRWLLAIPLAFLLLGIWIKKLPLQFEEIKFFVTPIRELDAAKSIAWAYRSCDVGVVD